MPAYDEPRLYINRYLSLLAFNWRVLAQAKDRAIPLLERLKYLCISSTNLDEFFEIQVAGLKQRVGLGSTFRTIDGLGASQTLEAICQEAHSLVVEQYRVLNDMLIPELRDEHICLLRRTEWSGAQTEWLRNYFHQNLLPVLSPMGLDPAHPFPRIINKSLNFVVTVEGRDAFGRNSEIAVVQAPRALPRVIELPCTAGGGFVFLSSVIHAFVDALFPGLSVRGCYQFRVTRNSDLFVDEEEVDDILQAIKGELPSRHFGDAVRLETAHDIPEDLLQFLLQHFSLTDHDLYCVPGPVNLNRLIAISDLVDKPELKYPPMSGALSESFRAREVPIFDVIRKSDVLVHHPFEAFAPVLDFVLEAAADPNVLAIKQTLYRTGPDSPMVDALVKAAQAGKEVTVIMEIRARFDEADNIALANRLDEAGAHVVYGIVGFKTHAKLCLVVRREGKRLRRYVHLGTGNYHPHTAELYTDYGLFTADPALAEEVHRVFMTLTGPGRVPKLQKLKIAPFDLHTGLLDAIEHEARIAKTGKQARIVAKLNALVEQDIIRALYRASAAGVRIHLIVRGMCCLRPGVKGVSDNIHVRSIVGRFLEHHRVWSFGTGGRTRVYCSSADWMERNFFRRVEVAFPVEDRKLRNRLVKDLKLYLRDNANAWVLESDGNYRQLRPRGTHVYAAQTILLQDLGGN